ncbi:MAG: glucodextranase DOMON-like domain-containing protein, partial [Bacteroidota bacterium]
RKYDGEEQLVLLNTAEEPMLLTRLETGAAAGTRLELIQGLHFSGPLQVDEKGALTTVLAPRAAGLFSVSETTQTHLAGPSSVTLDTQIDGAVLSDNFWIEGKLTNTIHPHLLVIDGKLKRAIPLQTDPDGNWKVEVPLTKFPFGRSKHDFTIYCPATNQALPLTTFQTDIAIQGRKSRVVDAAGDDHGLARNYRKPQDPSYGAQMDILEVETTSFGGNLMVELTMGALSQAWLPPNGFDHVLFHLFIDLPNGKGSQRLSMLQADAPADFAWDYAAYLGGWQVAYYAAEEKDQTAPKKLSVAPTIKVDPESRKITFQFSPEALGYIEDLQGAKIYVTTWDCYGSEGGYRRMTEEGELWKFGGSADPNAARILDASSVVEIK